MIFNKISFTSSFLEQKNTHTKMQIQCIRNYDSNFYFKSSLLICSFIHSNDNRRFKSIDPRISNLSDSKFTRLNSSILKLKCNIFDIFRIVQQVYYDTDAYVKVGLASLNIYLIVHPDTRCHFIKTSIPIDFLPVKLYIYTYDNFFSEIVGSAIDIDSPKRKKFLNSLKDSIFIFEDTDWYILQLAFKMSLIILSGGSNTKKQFLSTIEYRLSQFLIATFVYNKIDLSKIIETAHSSLPRRMNPLIRLRELARTANTDAIRFVSVSRKDQESYEIDSVVKFEILNIIRNNYTLLAIIKSTSFTIQREYPGFNFYFFHPDGVCKLVYDAKPLSSIEKSFSQNLYHKPQNKDVSSRKYHTSSLNPSFKPVVSNLIKVKPIYFKPFYSSYTIKSLLSNQNKFPPFI